MKIDITLCVTPAMKADAQGNEKKAFTGHLGTHFDVMDKEFPLDYTELDGVCFDVSDIGQGEIQLTDIDMQAIGQNKFVAFYSSFIEQCDYGTPTYFHEHPTLSTALIEQLIALKVSIIGIDFAGVRRGCEHTPTDQKCADQGVFIIENLCNLSRLWSEHPQTSQSSDKFGKGNTRPIAYFKAHTYPMHFANMSGLPCRVVADI